MAKIALLERVKGLARVGIFSTCVFVGLGLCAARTARSQAGEASMLIGREFAGISDLVQHGYQVRLNGEVVRVGSTTVDLPTNEALDRFEGFCKQGSHGFEDVLKDGSIKVPQVKEDLRVLGILGLGVLRIEKGDEGIVACVTHPDTSSAALTERALAFSKSLDLKDLGRLRYTYVRSTADRARTQVITAWTEGSLRIDRVFTAEGDAPGADSTSVPRPPSSQRRLTAEVDGAPYSVRLYESSASPEEVMVFYDKAMRDAGWEPAETLAKSSKTSRGFSRPGVDVMVVTAPPDQAGGKTSVSLIEMPTKDSATVKVGKP